MCERGRDVYEAMDGQRLKSEAREKKVSFHDLECAVVAPLQFFKRLAFVLPASATETSGNTKQRL